MNQTSPPQLPPGWIALWDDASQRYYYLEQATGQTQWDIPSTASKPTENATRGEANSYNTNFSNQGGYQSYPQQQQQPGAVATSYPTQQTNQDGVPMTEGEQQDRGLGKIMHGFSGGAITGSLIGFAAGKLLGNHNKPSSGNNNYGHFPPQYGGGYGGGGYNYGPPPPSNYGSPPPSNYGPPGGYGNHAPHAPYGQHGQHGHHGGHHHGW